MKKYFLFNTLINLGLILMIFAAVAAYNSGQYVVMVASIAICIILVYLKVNLLKKVREETRRK